MRRRPRAASGHGPASAPRGGRRRTKAGFWPASSGSTRGDPAIIAWRCRRPSSRATRGPPAAWRRPARRVARDAGSSLHHRPRGGGGVSALLISAAALAPSGRWPAAGEVRMLRVQVTRDLRRTACPEAGEPFLPAFPSGSAPGTVPTALASSGSSAVRSATTLRLRSAEAAALFAAALRLPAPLARRLLSPWPPCPASPTPHLRGWARSASAPEGGWLRLGPLAFASAARVVRPAEGGGGGPDRGGAERGVAPDTDAPRRPLRAGRGRSLPALVDAALLDELASALRAR